MNINGPKEIKLILALFMNWELTESDQKAILGLSESLHLKDFKKFKSSDYPEDIGERLFRLQDIQVYLSSSVLWKNKEIGYQIIDFLIENKIILEIKVTSELNRLHQAQLLSYLKATNKKLGLLLNFGEGILIPKRVVNDF